MHRTLAVLGLALAGCCLAPFAWAGGPPKQVQAKPFTTVAPPSLPPSIAPPPAPPGTVQVARPDGHLDQATFTALTSGVTAQASDPRGLFERSGDVTLETVERGLLVCRVQVTGGGYDDSLFAGGADVYLVLTIGSTAARRSPHRSLRIFTYPVTDLERGDPLQVTVMDQDVFFHDTIGRGQAAYTGGETRIEAGGANVVCRPARPELVERGRERALREVSRSIDRLSRTEPDMLAYDFGYPRPRTTEVLDAVRGALAYVPLSDDALDAQVDRAIDFEDAWQTAVQDAIEESSAELPAPGAEVALSRMGAVRVSRLACGADAVSARDALGDSVGGGSGCLLTLELTPRRRGELGAETLEAWGIDDDGGMLTATLEASRGADGSWAPAAAPRALARGESVTLAMTFPPGTRPVLVRLRGGGRGALLRLE